MEAHSKVVQTMLLKLEPQGVTKAQESARQMSRWWTWLRLIASHGKPFQNVAHTTFRCCLSGIMTFRWSVSIPEDAQTAPKQIGNSGWRRTARPPLTEQTKRATWHRNLDRISKSKDAKQAWSTVRFLHSRESNSTGKSLLYKGRVYASDHAKASAFVQEYTMISSCKSDTKTKGK